MKAYGSQLVFGMILPEKWVDFRGVDFGSRGGSQSVDSGAISCISEFRGCKAVKNRIVPENVLGTEYNMIY